MELKVHHDKIVSSMARWKQDEATRASDAGETREEIGSLIELTGVHKKAFSWARSLDKLEQDKRDDILRSFDALRELLEPHWRGQSTPDMFTDDGDDFEADEVPTPDPGFDDFEAQVQRFAPDDDTNVIPFDPEEDVA